MGCSTAWQSPNGPFISAERVTSVISASHHGCQRRWASETDPSPVVSWNYGLQQSMHMDQVIGEQPYQGVSCTCHTPAHPTARSSLLHEGRAGVMDIVLALGSADLPCQPHQKKKQEQGGFRSASGLYQVPWDRSSSWQWCRASPTWAPGQLPGEQLKSC